MLYYWRSDSFKYSAPRLEKSMPRLACHRLCAREPADRQGIELDPRLRPAPSLCPHEELNLDPSLRRAMLYPLSYGGKSLVRGKEGLFYLPRTNSANWRIWYGVRCLSAYGGNHGRVVMKQIYVCLSNIKNCSRDIPALRKLFRIIKTGTAWYRGMTRGRITDAFVNTR